MRAHESRSVLRRLPVDQIEEIEAESGVGKLSKSLGLWQLTAIGVGGIIGVGIFSRISGRSAVLRRVRRHDPEGRFGVHVRLRRAR
jgi:hypothetical protein